MHRLILTLAALFSINFLFSQSITGKVVNSESANPIIGAEIIIEELDLAEYSNSQGNFRLLGVGAQSGVIKIKAEGFEDSFIDFQASGEDLNLGVIVLEISSRQQTGEDVLDGFAILSFEDISSDDEEFEISSVLTASRDPFNARAAYDFGSVSYSLRGYERDQSRVHLNGILFNDIEDGQVYWGTWGGLNDVFRARNDVEGLTPAEFSFGGLSGDVNIDLRASAQWKQKRVTYNFGNLSYQNRLMATYSTGLMSNGWAFSFSGSKRWGNQGYVAGTYYDAYSYFGAAERQFNDRHSLSLNVFGAISRRGRVGPSFKEIYELLGDNYYNPYWGYQNGKVRNTREYRTHQPITMLRHDWTISDKMRVSTSAAYMTGKNAASGLNWFLAPDPRPDYYRNLASFQESEDIQNLVNAFFLSDPNNLQVQWDDMIRINQNRGIIGLGIGANDIDLPEGNLSAYTSEESHYDQNKYAFQTRINAEPGERSTISGGVQLVYDQNQNFRILDDLLGGDYSVDIDRFAIRDFPDDLDIIQNDLNNPNRIVQEGDVIGYDYTIHNQKAEVWGSYTYSFPKVDVFAAVNGNLTRFWREGKMRVGRFPDNSFGEGEIQSFLNGGVKLGGTYKFNGRNYFYTNGVFNSKAPYSREAYTSPRTRHETIDNLRSAKEKGVELGYLARYPRLNARLTGYYTLTQDGTDNASFYNDDVRSFVNYIMNGIDTKHMGMELGFDAKVTSTVSFKGALGLGRFTYDSRPTVTITQDNNATQLVTNRTIYIQNYNIPNMPRMSSSATIEYRSPDYWSVAVNANYFTGRFADINPERRTINAVDGVTPEENPELWHQIIDQEELTNAFTVDFFGRKSFKFDQPDSRLEIMVSVNNILNNRTIEKIAFEQGRFDYETKDVDRFPNRYFYNFGTTYSLSVSYKFE